MIRSKCKLLLLDKKIKLKKLNERFIKEYGHFIKNSIKIADSLIRAMIKKLLLHIIYLL
jgi:hypothetical protein